MKRLVLVALALVACGHPRDAAPPTRPLPPLPESPSGIDRATAHAALSRLEGAVDTYCACADDACRGRSADAFGDEIARQMRDKVDELPPDLDAISAAVAEHYMACADEHGAAARAISPVLRLGAAAIRDEACACSDASCAAREDPNIHGFIAKAAQYRVDDATRTEVVAALKEARRCDLRLEVEQAVLDVKAIRTELDIADNLGHGVGVAL